MIESENRKQRERIAVSQMTPEQRDAYYRMKERDRRIAEKEAQDNFNALMYCCGCIAIYGLIMDLADN